MQTALGVREGDNTTYPEPPFIDLHTPFIDHHKMQSEWAQSQPKMETVQRWDFHIKSNATTWKVRSDVTPELLKCQDHPTGASP